MLSDIKLNLTKLYAPTGIRTRVSGAKGRRPWPLDYEGVQFSLEKENSTSSKNYNRIKGNYYVFEAYEKVRKNLLLNLAIFLFIRE